MIHHTPTLDSPMVPIPLQGAGNKIIFDLVNGKEIPDCVTYSSTTDLSISGNELTFLPVKSGGRPCSPHSFHKGDYARMSGNDGQRDLEVIRLFDDGRVTVRLTDSASDFDSCERLFSHPVAIYVQFSDDSQVEWSDGSAVSW